MSIITQPDFICQDSTPSFALDFLGNFRSAVLLVSFALCFAPLPCNTPSIAAVESLCTGQNILRIPALLQIPRKSNII